MGRKVGAYYSGGICDFTVWAPKAEKVELLQQDRSANPLFKDSRGYWHISLEIPLGTYYKFLIDGNDFPDPASRSQPEGVHSWSEVVSNQYNWTDVHWKGIPTSEMLIYELHVGTFSEEGIFDGVLNKLDHFLELGINTLEIMPIAQFPGSRNWGYDGVFPFAVQNSYGSRESLKNLVNTCHSKGLAVLLDVVYNHLGPEGNYLSAFGPYFTEKYRTPWGSALNFDDSYSNEVRNFFLQNALMWLEDFHFDGLRLDAVQEIIDRGAKHFLQELRERIDGLELKTGRDYVLIAESDLNDTRLIKPYSTGGYGLQAQWVDDFHHSIHTLLTGEKTGYYSDYGSLELLAKSFRQGFVYDGIYSHFRKRSVGNSPANCSPSNFVVCIQNHDQVGNRVLGERLSTLVSFEALKLAAALLLISPYVPMLFMGEEFAEDQPFQYFISHSDPKLIKAVQEGRRKEFSYFFQKDTEEFPDPQAEETFNNSRLNWDHSSLADKNIMFRYYQELLRLRKAGRFSPYRTSSLSVDIAEEGILQISGSTESRTLFAVVNFNKESKTFNLPSGMQWQEVFYSADKKWGGSEGQPSESYKQNAVIAAQAILLVEAFTAQKYEDRSR